LRLIVSAIFKLIQLSFRLLLGKLLQIFLGKDQRENAMPGGVPEPLPTISLYPDNSLTLCRTLWVSNIELSQLAFRIESLAMIQWYHLWELLILLKHCLDPPGWGLRSAFVRQVQVQPHFSRSVVAGVAAQYGSGSLAWP
jgi:hypothetical protein